MKFEIEIPDEQVEMVLEILKGLTHAAERRLSESSSRYFRPSYIHAARTANAVVDDMIMDCQHANQNTNS